MSLVPALKKKNGAEIKQIKMIGQQRRSGTPCPRHFNLTVELIESFFTP